MYICTKVQLYNFEESSNRKKEEGKSVFVISRQQKTTPSFFTAHFLNVCFYKVKNKL